MFTFLYDKFTRDNAYQNLPQSVKFCRLYIKKHFGVFFSGSQCSCVVSELLSFTVFDKIQEDTFILQKKTKQVK